MANAPEDIIELTDIIERGPGAPKSDEYEAGGDRSLERELEDLFADGPETTSAAASDGLPDLDGLPGLDGLDLPSDTAAGGAGDDIDLDGLDALLAEAERSPASDPLPELGDDFFNEPKADASPAEPDLSMPDLSMPDVSAFDVAAPAAAVAATAAVGATAAAAGAFAAEADPAIEALQARLEALEDRFAGLGDTLANSFQSLVDDKIEAFKAELPPAPDIQAIEASFDERLEALKGELASAQPEADDTAEAADPAALLAEAEARLQSELHSLKERLDAAPAAPDMSELTAGLATTEALAELDAKLSGEIAGLATSQALTELGARLDSEVAELAHRLDDLPAPVSTSLTAEDLDARLEAFKAELPTPEPAAADESPLEGEIEALKAQLADVEANAAARAEASVAARLAELPTSEDLTGLRADVAALAQRLEALEGRLTTLEARPMPDTSALVTQDALAALRQELQAEIRKSVPAAAAQVIREEIMALVKDMGA